MEYTKTLFLGDSIVKGIVPENGRYKVLESSYYNKFTEAVFSPTENKGKFGLTSSKFLKNIEKLKNSDADVIFFSIGGNDCNLNWREISEDPSGIHLPAVSKTDFEANLIRIYSFFAENNMNVIAMNFPPLHAEKFFSFLSGSLNGERILEWLQNISRIYYHHESYNNIFESVTRNFGIDLIDIRSRFLREEDIGSLISMDGMHPSPEGHELIYRCISNHLLYKTVQLQHTLNRPFPGRAPLL